MLPQRSQEIAKIRHPLHYLRPHLGRISLGIGALIATNIMVQSVPWFVKRTIETLEETLQGKANRSQVVVYLSIIVILAILQTLTRIGSRILVFNVGRDAEYELRRDIFAHLCCMDHSFYRRFRVGDLMSRLTNDLSSVRALIGAGVLHGINTVFAYAIALPMMFKIDASLALLAFIPYPIMTLVARTFARKIYQRTNAQQVALSAMTSAVQEDLTGIRELKIYRIESQRAGQFEAISKQYLAEGERLTAWRTGMGPLVGLGLTASTVLVLWFGGKRVIDGDDLTLGDLIALNMYVGTLSSPTFALGWLLSMWQRGIAGWHRLTELLSHPPTLVDDPQVIDVAGAAPGPDAHHLEVRRLSLSLDEKPILRDVDLAIPSGTICAIVGKVGSGKTILVESIARLIGVPANTVFLSGTDVTTLTLKSVRSHIAYAPQEAFLFSASIYDNIACGISDELLANPNFDKDSHIHSAIVAAGFDHDIAGFPDGVNTVVGERGIMLSGGQRQRVALARALAAKRPLLILDDSLSSVDAETEHRILEGLGKMIQGTTTLLISHRLSALQYADQILVMDEGRIVERGTHQDLLARSGLYAQLYQRQILEQGDASVGSTRS